MDSFDLQAQPFLILGVTPRDRPEVLADALARRLAEPGADEDQLHRAYRCLMAPRPRLEAEVKWLVGVAPGRAAAVLRTVERGDEKALAAVLEVIPGLGRANLAAYLAAANPNRAILDTLIAAYDEIDPADVAETINVERAVAGFSPAKPALVAEALEGLRERHLGVAMGAIAGAAHPGQLMTALVEARQESQGGGWDFLEALAERFDRWSASTLGQVEERLQAAADRLRADSRDASALEAIVLSLEAWDEYSQPRQLIFRAKGLDEPRSKALVAQLRELGLWLANERQEYRKALALSQSLLAIFPELPSVDTRIRQDVKDLERLVRQSEEQALLADLITAVEQAKQNITLAAEIERGHFGPGGHGAAGLLYAAFAKAVRRAAGSEHADLPWLALRQLGIELHNEHKATRAALLFTVAIRSFAGAQPSRSVIQQLDEDEATLRRELLWREIRDLSEQRRWGQALGRLQELEGTTKDAAEREKIAAVRAQLGHRRIATIGRRIGWGAVAAAVICALWLADSDSRPPPPRAASSPAPAASSARFLTDEEIFGGAQASPPPAPSRTTETAPPAGRDRRLTRDQIRYCLFQTERLDAFRLVLTTNAQIDRFNRMVDDWNGRCSSYRYRPADMRVVERELDGERARLGREGHALASAGARTSAGSAEHRRQDDPIASDQTDGWGEAALLASPPTGTGVAPPRPSEPDFSDLFAAPGSSGPDPYAGLLGFENAPLAASAPDRAIRLLNPVASPVDAREVQRRLAALGLYATTIDGIWGPGSRRALAEFKRRAGLSADAVWDRATQDRLLQASER